MMLLSWCCRSGHGQKAKKQPWNLSLFRTSMAPGFFKTGMLGPCHSPCWERCKANSEKKARSWRIPCVANAKLPSSPICLKQEQTHIASIRRLRCPQVHIERLCMVISTKCQDPRSENCWGRKPLKCARLKWLFGSSSLGSSVVTGCDRGMVLPRSCRVGWSACISAFAYVLPKKWASFGDLLLWIYLFPFAPGDFLPATADNCRKEPTYGALVFWGHDYMHDSTCHMSSVYVLASKMTLALCMFCNVPWAKEKALKERGSMEIITDNYEVKKSMRFLLCAIDSASSMYFQGCSCRVIAENMRWY